MLLFEGAATCTVKYLNYSNEFIDLICIDCFFVPNTHWEGAATAPITSYPQIRAWKQGVEGWRKKESAYNDIRRRYDKKKK